MGAVWITFATENNVEGDIDFLAQEIGKAGVRARLHPLFPDEDEKIDRLMPAFLSRPDQCAAWILYGSPETLKEDRLQRITTVVNQASGQRPPFPQVGLFTNLHNMTQAEAIPFTERIFVDEPEWRERLGTALQIDLAADTASNTGTDGTLPAYVARLYPTSQDPDRFVFEFRPKMGRWDPVLFAILPEEKDKVLPHVKEHAAEEGFSDDAEWYFLRGQTPATPAVSYAVFMRELPTRMAFGQEGEDEMVILNVDRPE